MSGILFYVPIFFWSSSAKFVRLIYNYECWDMPDEGHLPPAITHQLPTLKPPALKSSNLKTRCCPVQQLLPSALGIISHFRTITLWYKQQLVYKACANVPCRQSPVVQKRIFNDNFVLLAASTPRQDSWKMGNKALIVFVHFPTMGRKFGAGNRQWPLKHK